MKKTIFASLTLILLALFISGCSDRVFLGNIYFGPEWMTASTIATIRGIREERYNGIGLRTFDAYREFLDRMSSEGTSEVIGDEITTDIASNFTYSTVATMLAYASGLGGGHFNKIIIRYYPPISEARADRIELYVPNATSFDWKPDGTGFVYSNTAGEIRSISLTGTDTLILAASNVGSVAYKHGSMILFTYLDGTVYKVALINEAATTRVNTGLESYTNLCISGANTNEAYGVKAGNYVRLNLTSYAETTVITSLPGNNPRLAPTGDKIVFDQDNALYVQDFTGTAAVKIKP